MNKQLGSTERAEVAASMLRSRVLFGAAAAVASVIGVSTSALGATTITPDNVNHWQHILDCAAALISDPDAHAQYCGPGHSVFVSGSTGFGSVPYEPSPPDNSDPSP